MLKDNEIEEIKMIIKKGFDLRLISAELNIPLAELEKYKSEIEKANKVAANRTSAKVNDLVIWKKKETSNTSNKKAITNPSNPVTSTNKSKEYPNSIPSQVDLIIQEIEKLVEQIEDAPLRKKRTTATIIISKLEDIKKYKLNINQSEKLYYLMQSKALKKLGINKTDKIDILMNKERKIMIGNLINAIDIAQSQTDDVDRLKSLLKKLPKRTDSSNDIRLDSMKNKIERKIYRLHQKNASTRLINNISPDIELIVKEIANGTLDLEKANEIIDQEAKNRRKGKPNNKFSLTEQQERGQILIQIQHLLRENSKTYKLQNPEATISILEKLCGITSVNSSKIVIENLLASQDFTTARQIYSKFYGNNPRLQGSPTASMLRKNIFRLEQESLKKKSDNSINSGIEL